ncbi:hypothetical protein CDD82_4865 [Ophiocordyceps australis]|uniref:PLD phosphodiesterase domain-containing protein n=1 Tax=Ophiocordyceps australis TaxID=1399860 RepID=A0A2C5Z5G1_9HYPO|nr:hypothetical protein CDD82_4865 [Ophiocordyceps australis]
MASTTFPSRFIAPWKNLVASHQAQHADDFPNHHVAHPESLVTTSLPQSLLVGTGYSIFTRAILPAIMSAQHSIHFVTCYWASSPTCDALRDSLTTLATRRRNATSRLQISIGFSSRGLFQKLLHTSSRNGYTYSPSQWPSLGLPDQETLRQGAIDLVVKSLFFTPFSVMHPKYVIVDDSTVFLPSCNVSWERWFEGCVELKGNVVASLLAFHQAVWGTLGDCESRPSSHPQNHPQGNDQNDPFDTASVTHSSGQVGAQQGGATTAIRSTTLSFKEAVPTILLPSSHHRNPGFSFFPFLSQSNPPMTPLNAALLTLFSNAQQDISILTPNVTCWTVVDALIDALSRGVNVQIRTSKGMMLIEQAVTAGTTTACCLNKLVCRYKALQQQRRKLNDAESQLITPGKLQIWYYKPLEAKKQNEDEPVLSHFKMTMVDGEYLLLGSGNMDRASWWTSQELGILFYVPGFSSHRLWDEVLDKRTEVHFCSKDG